MVLAVSRLAALQPLCESAHEAKPTFERMNDTYFGT